jgi:hypothetical protein
MILQYKKCAASTGARTVCLFPYIELRASVYLCIPVLDSRLPMTQVGSLRECRCPGVVHTGDLPPVHVVIQVIH